MLKESEKNSLICPVCENQCRIFKDSVGRCGHYENKNGIISEIYPNRYLLTCPIKIETMPMLHFHPGARFLQVSTVGCNFDCPGCISTVIVQEMDSDSKALRLLSPKQIIEKAIENNCQGITFLMNDPLATFDTFISVARFAKSRGLMVGCSSNGYFSRQALKQALPVLDFINIGIKGLSNSSYQSCGGLKGFAPVLRNIKSMYQAGIHIEIACIHKKDNKQELLELCSTIKKISADIPLQVMRFIPLEGTDPRQEPLIRDTEKLSLKMRNILKYVYVFNSPGTELLNTYCHKCKEPIIHRDFYGPMGARFKFMPINQANGSIHCPSCGAQSDIRGKVSLSDFRERDFQGGYPFTRALEIVESILIAIGVNDKSEVVRVWEYLLCNNKMRDLHHDIQRIEKYLKLIKFFGDLIHREKSANRLTDYLEEKTEHIKQICLNQKHRPRVYYAMGKPLFCIKGERFENHLIETCNGISLNKEIEITGRPGMSIKPQTLRYLNPEIIFISSFISNSPQAFYEECIEKDINIDAVHNKQIYISPIPCSDFGSPRWLIGLMNIANNMYPDQIRFDIQKESNLFYKTFYNTHFDIHNINRSFGKPNNSWKWNSSLVHNEVPKVSTL